MRAASCRFERDVQQAASSGRWAPDLRRHAADCRTCRQVALVTSMLAGDVVPAPRRVSPSILWAKARFLRRRRAEAIASRILVSTQVAIGTIGVVVLAYAGVAFAPNASLGSAGLWPWLPAAAGLSALAGLAAARWFARRA